ncbi:MAG: glycosyltransferase [Planctomycetes bacterium]|nr:glycosyltransferase [Planctomycetota bacterium]
MPAKLFLVSGAKVEPESPFAIPPRSRIVVGRGSDASFVVLDELASRNHFSIYHDGTEYLLEDLGSANGTYVNDRRIEGIVTLAHEDTIRAGHTVLRFVAAEDTPHRIIPEGQAGTGSSVIELPREGGAPIVRVSLAPVEGGPMGPRPGSILAFRWWKLPLYPLLIPLWFVLFPITEFRRARWDKAFGLCHPDHTVRNFAARHPREAANRVVAWYQKLWYLAIVLAALYVFNWHPLRFLHVLHVFCAFYLIVIAYKMVAVVLSMVNPGEIRVTPAEVAALKDDELPVYTILVPLYHETEVASKIIRYIRRLDYPQEKLDVKLLLEADDKGTLDVCRRAGLPANYEMVVVPDCKPKTKPKACNHGLERAKGEYLVIYDAEDRPEHDQLKKAIVAFRRANAPRGVVSRLLMRRSQTVCLQAKLNYYNTDQNLLTKWFTMEYSTWFDLFLPGIHRLGSPIPLGGTSNHFRTDVLKKIGGWDPFNVAEDCDLGIRLHKMGYRTEVLDSTTWEEANSRLWNWVRQRSRWVKGYIQTHLVHIRNPFKAFWRLGVAGTFGFLTSVGGLSLMLILNPIFWLLLLFYAACWVHDLSLSGWSWDAVRVFQAKFVAGKWPWDRWLNWDGPWVWQMWFADPRGNPFWNTWSQLFFYITAALFLANFFFVLMHIWACMRRRLYRLIPYAILSPFYWVLISLGAWKGFIQLFHNPFKWEKTIHGLDASAKGKE